MTVPAPIATLNDLFLRVAAAGNPRAILWQSASSEWQPISSSQIYQRVRAVAHALHNWGVQKGDRVAIIAENRWEWAIADFAILALGAVDVPIYPTLTGEQMAELLRDSDTRIAFVSTRKQLDKLAEVRANTPLQRIVIMDSADATAGAIPFSELVAGADERGSQRDDEFEAIVHSVKPGHLATLIYTSGTTGEPKGVMLTHGNIAANQNTCAREFSFSREDACISFLPLSHITARALDYVMYGRGAQVIYCSQFDRLPYAMREVRPTVLVGVPRVYEKIRQEVERRAALSPIRKKLLAMAVKIGAGHIDTVYSARTPASPLWKLANKLVFSKVQAAFGGRARVFISGGAPLGVDTARWFASVGIPVWEGYGLTETSPVIALNSEPNHRLGSVGKPVPNVELKFASDGELLCRGPFIFQGYWNKPQANAECFDAEGWFHTGDIGHLDHDGFLYITDRKKELLKTSGGKLVAPQPIENKIKTNILIGQVALIGDKHKFISALISPNFAALDEWARNNGLEGVTRASLVADRRVNALYNEIIREVNSGLANFETIKRFRIVPDEWSQDSGELTPSMKLKRRVIAERYAAAVSEIYADEATARAE
ncbi:AMP-dependent synthetase/ligase [Occallatibacter riparius]|uniref:Long-chain fatty acid--CoA ligase n=1 Tax=Occallatibacter riparius TaxID=1002689 RepID=A0A9J7BRM6_9BACT|nr:long-chain fatty acid--CoA ligase [Occallatibacter riparius]UWZ83574.1 long-chain fatty acid--CoA ligase [Occallatibacter riparius]